MRLMVLNTLGRTGSTMRLMPPSYQGRTGSNMRLMPPILPKKEVYPGL